MISRGAKCSLLHKTINKLTHSLYLIEDKSTRFFLIYFKVIDKMAVVRDSCETEIKSNVSFLL